jgi:hypothetical protein
MDDLINKTTKDVRQYERASGIPITNVALHGDIDPANPPKH